MSRLSFPVAVLVALSSLAVSEAANPSSPAKGLAVNIPVVGRLTGSGGILFKTAIDVSNNTGTAAQVDFHLVATAGASAIAVDGSISSSGTLVARGTGGTVRGHFNYHSDDFVDALVHAGMISASQESAGVLGSVRFVFNGFTKSGQGSAAANFYRDLVAGAVSGTIGVSATGHEISANEPVKLVGTFRNTLGKPGPQVYPNLFINNMGVTPVTSNAPCDECQQAAAATAVDVQITAYSNTTGNPIGVTKSITGIAPGQTTVFGNVLSALSVPASEDTVVVYVTVVSGNASIAALAVQVDNGTHDSTSVEMHRADL
jgi:hypothetical protein